jgi:hypothetical protein
MAERTMILGLFVEGAGESDEDSERASTFFPDSAALGLLVDAAPSRRSGGRGPVLVSFRSNSGFLALPSMAVAESLDLTSAEAAAALAPVSEASAEGLALPSAELLALPSGALAGGLALPSGALAGGLALPSGAWGIFPLLEIFMFVLSLPHDCAGVDLGLGCSALRYPLIFVSARNHWGFRRTLGRITP